MNPTPMIIRIGMGTHRRHRSPFNPSSCDSVRKRVVRMPSRARASHRSGRTCCWVFIFLVVSGREIVDDHHLPAGLIRLHDAMRFADLLEAKHTGRLGLEPARRHLLRVVAMIRAPALTAILSAAWPNDEVAPRITSVWSLVISRLRKRQVHAVA